MARIARTDLKTRIPNKTHDIGLKAYVIADSKSAYCLDFEIKAKPYQGSTFEGTEVVRQLVSRAGLTFSGRTVVGDNYYSSVEVVDVLKSMGLLYLGVLRNSRVPAGGCTLRM